MTPVRVSVLPSPKSMVALPSAIVTLSVRADSRSAPPDQRLAPKYQHVFTRGEIADAIIATGKDEQIGIRTACHNIIAGIADQIVAAVTAIDAVVTLPPNQEIIAATTLQHVAARAAVKEIKAFLAGHCVVAPTCKNGIPRAGGCEVIVFFRPKDKTRDRECRFRLDWGFWFRVGLRFGRRFGCWLRCGSGSGVDSGVGSGMVGASTSSNSEVSPSVVAKFCVTTTLS